jgi:hypothetical protein
MKHYSNTLLLLHKLERLQEKLRAKRATTMSSTRAGGEDDRPPCWIALVVIAPSPTAALCACLTHSSKNTQQQQSDGSFCHDRSCLASLLLASSLSSRSPPTYLGSTGARCTELPCLPPPAAPSSRCRSLIRSSVGLQQTQEGRRRNLSAAAAVCPPCCALCLPRCTDVLLSLAHSLTLLFLCFSVASSFSLLRTQRRLRCD